MTPPPESHPTKTHNINLNDKLEYKRSTIPDPNETSPTEDKIKQDKGTKNQITKLRSEYVKIKKSKTKPKPKWRAKLKPNR